MPLHDSIKIASETGGHWHALYTRHQHEKTIARILGAKGHEVFLPLYQAAHQWQDRVKQLFLPLFPCYVFLRGGMDSRTQILSIPGVHAIVGWAGCPAIIPELEIEAIRRVVTGDFHAEPHPFLKCGDRVRVKCGPLRGLEGMLVRCKTFSRLVISVEMLGRSVAVEMDATRMERVFSSPSRNTPIPAVPHIGRIARGTS